jgi:hypothetical protein
MRTRFILSITAILGLSYLGCKGSNGGTPTPGNGPQIQVVPGAATFGQVFGRGTPIGTTYSNALAVTNVGNATLDISGSTLAGDSAFRVQGPYDPNQQLATSVPAGQSVAYNVTFTPTQAKEYSGTLTINSNAANSPSDVINLAGCGVAPTVLYGPDGGMIGVTYDAGTAYCVIPFDAGA